MKENTETVIIGLIVFTLANLGTIGGIIVFGEEAIVANFECGNMTVIADHIDGVTTVAAYTPAGEIYSQVLDDETQIIFDEFVRQAELNPICVRI